MLETHPPAEQRGAGEFSAEREGLERIPSADDSFARRHIGPGPGAIEAMLRVLGLSSLDELVKKAIPSSIRAGGPLNLPPPLSEHEMLERLKEIAGRNRVYRSYIGMGYSGCIVPPVIQRNLLENPGWYTQYTPYQAEIAQGRLEALLTFQTMIMDLTGLEIANASMLDEATAAAEAMTLCFAAKGTETRAAIFVSEACHPQTIDVVKTRANPLGIQVVVGDHRRFQPDDTIFAVLLQYPTTLGGVEDYQPLIERSHQQGAMAIVAADLLSLTLLRPPGDFGADIAVGNAQRFGVPPGYGGPHAAYFATRDASKRQLPGRLVGVSKDSQGKPACRLALQTREQHIRREKATSNICTAQALLANMAAMYAVYHGPEGLKQIASKIRRSTLLLALALKNAGHQILEPLFFDTIHVQMEGLETSALLKLADENQINLRFLDDSRVSVSLDETTSRSDLDQLVQIFNGGKRPRVSLDELETGLDQRIPRPFERSTPFLTHAVFHRHRSETEMLRYLRRLESRDLSLTHSMIPLGSCTMKLNAAAEMFPLSWPEFNQLHPFVPLDQAKGYQALFRQLEEWLAEITGFAAVSLQPNAGSQGEYAGLLVIRKFHQSRGEAGRRICLIPQSAHGTNPASAVLAGLSVAPVACDKEGNIDLADLKTKAEKHSRELAALMVTYPSTHGVFEESIREVCNIIHENGGQVYMDGANMNAQVGLCRPAELGADVCHLNLHKTFCIPHGGGGPGMGPICAAAHLAEYLPGHPVVPPDGKTTTGAVSAAPWGSASILTISWAYIAMMGAEGLTRATQVAILNANYLAHHLSPYFPVLYKGRNGMVAHECILDLRQFKNVTVEDVAKRLMDYGFHAPTISWPVSGTMMIEPTESESQEELDRFCDALISIHAEIMEIESGRVDRANNLLKNAPHTAEMIASENWNRPYSREQAVFPRPWVKEHKFWPAVGRIDNVYGDRRLVCSCPGMEAHV
jgi:glycine dehydrogenase